jgi:hypothetical protein
MVHVDMGMYVCGFISVSALGLSAPSKLHTKNLNFMYLYQTVKWPERKRSVKLYFETSCTISDRRKPGCIRAFN